MKLDILRGIVGVDRGYKILRERGWNEPTLIEYTRQGMIMIEKSLPKNSKEKRMISSYLEHIETIPPYELWWDIKRELYRNHIWHTF